MRSRKTVLAGLLGGLVLCICAISLFVSRKDTLPSQIVPGKRTAAKVRVVAAMHESLLPSFDIFDFKEAILVESRARAGSMKIGIERIDGRLKVFIGSNLARHAVEVDLSAKQGEMEDRAQIFDRRLFVPLTETPWSIKDEFMVFSDKGILETRIGTKRVEAAWTQASNVYPHLSLEGYPLAIAKKRDDSRGIVGLLIIKKSSGEIIADMPLPTETQYMFMVLDPLNDVVVCVDYSLRWVKCIDVSKFVDIPKEIRNRLDATLRGEGGDWPENEN
jgi:hypothetical protein